MRINFNLATLSNSTQILKKDISIQQKVMSFKSNYNQDDYFDKEKDSKNLERGTYEWALHWDEDERKKELENDFEKAKKGMSWWKRNFTYALEELKTANNKTLETERLLATTLLKNAVNFQERFDKINEKETEINARSSELKKLDNASKLSTAFRIENEGGLDDCIAGYEAEKEIIRSAFIDQIALEKSGLEANVPNSMLFYGPIATGKTVMAQSAAREAGAYLVETNPDNYNFRQTIDEKLKEARDRYLQTTQRTVILINEIDTFLANESENKFNISKMKNWLDNAAKIPVNDIDNAFATTFIFTTNHPLSITNEILFRDEKLGKIISFEPAANGNIEEIIKFYLEKIDKNGLAIGKENINYNKIIERMNPDDEKGAFGTDRIKKIINKAFVDFNKDVDKEKTLEEHLINSIDKIKRNIYPENLQEFKEQMEEIYED